MMQDSAGAVIGALLGSWLLQYDFRLVCSAGARAVYRLCGIQCLVSPGTEEAVDGKKPRFVKGTGRVLRDKRFVTYVLTLTGYYMPGGAGDAHADHGQRYCRFSGGGKMDVRH